ncbi:hypothetical protein L596_000896 [Steinernema carpocapsae]|uniref:Uncharacterized protein n=1 Tax=Steinernema carpocapsae TaxID=34508 RepID=A0A4U8UJF7_STECR|nr:hypothetical protein L596_000896 [Steinernema carpocapsae]
MTIHRMDVMIREASLNRGSFLDAFESDFDSSGQFRHGRAVCAVVGAARLDSQFRKRSAGKSALRDFSDAITKEYLYLEVTKLGIYCARYELLVTIPFSILTVIQSCLPSVDHRATLREVLKQTSACLAKTKLDSEAHWKRPMLDWLGNGAFRHTFQS